ncbi:MAG: hypothetical protein GQ546_03215 [Gammaproteobacteria bacterium]|nr:hypothetical protein [Gammaproteobacteria bacterium]
MLPITDWLSEGKKFKDSQTVAEVQQTRTIKDIIRPWGSEEQFCKYLN